MKRIYKKRSSELNAEDEQQLRDIISKGDVCVNALFYDSMNGWQMLQLMLAYMRWI